MLYQYTVVLLGLVAVMTALPLPHIAGGVVTEGANGSVSTKMNPILLVEDTQPVVIFLLSA